MRGWRIGALAFAASAFVATLGMPGTAFAQVKSGPEHFTIIELTSDGGPVNATGVFNKPGTDEEHNANSNSPTGTSTFTFVNGKIFVTHTDNPGGSQSFNPVTCVLTISGTGSYTITGGTGRYSDVEGHGTYTYHGRFGFAHKPSGCGNNVRVGNIIVQAHGPISF